MIGDDLVEFILFLVFAPIVGTVVLLTGALVLYVALSLIQEYVIYRLNKRRKRRPLP